MGDACAAAMTDYGDNGGRVMVVGFGSLLNDANMGETWMRPPSAEVQQRYDVLFALLRLLSTTNPSPRPTSPRSPSPKKGSAKGS